MVKNLFQSGLLMVMLLCSAGLIAQDGATQVVDSRYTGAWQGNWLEGMSSGGVTLELAENGGRFALSGLPAFGTEPVAISKIKASDRQLAFQTAGADGRVMRFELKLSADYTKLKGKVYHEGSHMEVELKRVQ